MTKEIWVAGYPSLYGGADTELAHQIVLWRRSGVEVKLVPLFGCDARSRKTCDDLGCETLSYRPGIFKDRVVVSFCNGEFLNLLPTIAAEGRPRTTVWANCMTYPFQKELEAHRSGLIDLFLFQSDYQRRILKPKLSEIRSVSEWDYLPFYDTESTSLTFSYRPPKDYFGVGRISRDDPSKFASDTWRIFNRVLSPRPIKAFILGYSDKLKEKIGQPPDGLDWAWWSPGAMPASDLYQKIHALVHKTGGSRENLPRVMMEAWHTGTALVCEDDYGFAEHVENGVTGFRCRSSDEMSFRASELAFNEGRRRTMIEAGYTYLKRTFGDAGRCFASWKKLLN